MAAREPQAIVVLVTFPSLEEANRIADVLLNEKMAACVNLLAGVQSTFFWQGAREEAREVLALVKTTPERFIELAGRVKSLHSYSVPEIIALPIVAADESYLEWLTEAVSKQ